MTAPADMTRRLRAARDLLAAQQAPTEQSFLRYGEVLSKASSSLRAVGGNFGALSNRLSSSDSQEAAHQLSEAVRQVVALAERHDGGETILSSLAAKIEQVARQVTMLRKIVGEVAVLAMNAKVQASHLSQSNNDFAVFTVEIARLGALALATVDQTASRIVQLRQIVQEARQQTTDCERHSARELPRVQERLKSGLDILAERRDAAARSAAEVGQRTSQVARQLADAIGGMQINDIAAQCITHVCSALDVIADLLEPERKDGKDDLDWLSELDENRRGALSGVVLRLQSAQLGRTRDEFRQQVDELAANMRGLAESARTVSGLADRAFAGHSLAGASFIDELGADMTAARDLLRQMEESRLAVTELTRSMASDFSSMAVDLRNIQSIDADMRVMGLNATLKCGRLGDQGRALGVIAQELRGCSKRTEEHARRLSAILAEAMSEAESLAQSSNNARDDLSHSAGQSMDSSLHTLGQMGHDLDEAFARLRAEVDSVTTQLDKTAGGMDIGHGLSATLDRAIGEIDALAAIIDPSISDPRAVRQEVERLLRGHYTMDSERVVHDLFADTVEPTPQPSAAAATTASVAAMDDLEDCFL